MRNGGDGAVDYRIAEYDEGQLSRDGRQHDNLLFDWHDDVHGADEDDEDDNHGCHTDQYPADNSPHNPYVYHCRSHHRSANQCRSDHRDADQCRAKHQHPGHGSPDQPADHLHTEHCPPQHGAVQHGPTHDGPTHDGPTHDGPVDDGPTHDRDPDDDDHYADHLHPADDDAHNYSYVGDYTHYGQHDDNSAGCHYDHRTGDLQYDLEHHYVHGPGDDDNGARDDDNRAPYDNDLRAGREPANFGILL